MKSKDMNAFSEWYEENKHKPFDLQQQLLLYYRANVDIL